MIQNEERKINVLAKAGSLWQVDGIKATIDHFNEQGLDTYTFLVLTKHSITGSMVDASLIEKENNLCVKAADSDFFQVENNKIVRVIKQFYYIFTNKDNRKPIYILSPGIIDYNMVVYLRTKTKRYFKYVLIDDGLGGYTGYHGLQKFWKMKSIVDKMLISLLRRHNAFIDHRLFYLDNKELRINKSISKHYYSVMKNSETKIPNSTLDKFSGAIIINTQCLFDNHEIVGDEDIQVWRILYEVLKQWDVKVLLKPHPREVSLERYKVFPWEIITDCQFSQEEVFSKLDELPLCVIGISSSSLPNLSALFNVKTISLAHFFMDQPIKDGMRKDTRDFIRLCHNIVDIPKNTDELVTILKNALVH